MKAWNDIVANCVTAEGVATLNCIPAVFQNIIFALFLFAGIVAIFIIIQSGAKFVLSSGDPKKVEEARNGLVYALLGLILVAAAYLIVNLVSFATGVSCIKFFGFECGTTPIIVPPPTPTPGGPTLTATPTPTPGGPTPTPSLLGCADTTVDQDFGTTSAGKKVHGCNGVVDYSSLGTLCAFGWHVGDVGPSGDLGLGNLLASNPSDINVHRRTVYINGSATVRFGLRNPSGPVVDECWGSLLPCDTENIQTTFMLTHIESVLGVTRTAYFEGLLMMSNNAVGATRSFTDSLGNVTTNVQGAICVEN